LTQPAPTPDTVAAGLRIFIRPGQVTELRALHVGGPWRTFAGFFHYDHLRDMARHALALSREAAGVYFIPNPIDPALLARRPNTCSNVPPKKSPQRIELTTDRDVIERRYLIVDFDPVRFQKSDPASDPESKPIRPGHYRTALPPAEQKQPATCEEIRLAQGIAEQLTGELVHQGWSAPVVMMSGNGIHLVFRLSSPVPYFPAEIDPLAELLRGLAHRYTCPGFLTLDTNTYTASRMLKVPGTMVRKGETESPGRPWRRAEIIEVPNGWDSECTTANASTDAHADVEPRTESPGRIDPHAVEDHSRVEVVTG
jgi:hypothetical protein